VRESSLKHKEITIINLLCVKELQRVGMKEGKFCSVDTFQYGLRKSIFESFTKFMDENTTINGQYMSD